MEVHPMQDGEPNTESGSPKTADSPKSDTEAPQQPGEHHRINEHENRPTNPSEKSQKSISSKVRKKFKESSGKAALSVTGAVLSGTLATIIGGIALGAFTPTTAPIAMPTSTPTQMSTVIATMPHSTPSTTPSVTPTTESGSTPTIPPELTPTHVAETFATQRIVYQPWVPAAGSRIFSGNGAPNLVPAQIEKAYL